MFGLLLHGNTLDCGMKIARLLSGALMYACQYRLKSPQELRSTLPALIA
jgi:hypothetical protein